MKLAFLGFLLLILNTQSYATTASPSSNFRISVRYNIMTGSEEIEVSKQFAILEAWRQAEEKCDEQNLQPEEVVPVEPLPYPIADTYHKVTGVFRCN